MHAGHVSTYNEFHYGNFKEPPARLFKRNCNPWYMFFALAYCVIPSLVPRIVHKSLGTRLRNTVLVQVTSEGRPYLVAAIGTEDFVISHVGEGAG